MTGLQQDARASLLLFLVALLTLVTTAAMATTAAAAAERLVVEVKRLPLDAADPERLALGSLRYRGGIELSAADRRFGGISGLRVSRDGSRFVAVEDFGYWLTGRLLYDGDGRLAGVADVELAAMRGPAGRLLGDDKSWGDAEALTAGADGRDIVAFEDRHRLLRFARRSEPGQPIATPSELAQAPDNAGIEALTTLPDGRLLLITERFEVAGGVRGWIGPAPWGALTLATSAGFRPTDAATLPGGDVLLLERRFPFLAARIRRLPADAIKPGATLAGREIARFEGSLTYDNMEAMAVRSRPEGGVLVYLASDDNRNFLQRTILLMFELAD
jgi:hypothetical protein